MLSPSDDIGIKLIALEDQADSIMFRLYILMRCCIPPAIERNIIFVFVVAALARYKRDKRDTEQIE